MDGTRLDRFGFMYPDQSYQETNERHIDYMTTAAPPFPAAALPSNSTVTGADENLSEIILLVYTCTIIILGGIGNGILVYVHLRRKNDSRGPGGSKIQVLNHFIFVMAVLDFTVCAIILPIQVTTLLSNYTAFPDLACKFFAFGRMFGVYASMFELVAIALDRFVSVCFPFATHLAINLPRAHKLTWAALAGAGVAAVPNVYVFKISRVDGGKHLNCQPDENDPTVMLISDLIFYMTAVLYAICVLVIIVFYTCVFLSVLKKETKRREMMAHQTNNQSRPATSADSTTGKTGFMLGLVTAVVILAWTPYWTVCALSFMGSPLIRLVADAHLMNVIGSSYYINNAANPLIYTFVNDKFRREISDAILCWRTKPRPGQATSMVTKTSRVSRA